MPWMEKDAATLAADLGMDINEVKNKLRISETIVKTRKRMGLTQAGLAKKAGVSQSRIAQIESGVGTARITYDVLLGILSKLGVSYNITLRRKAAA